MKATLIYGTAAPAGRLSAALDTFRKAIEASGATTATVVSLTGATLDGADGRPLEKLPLATRDMVSAVSGADTVIVLAPVYRATAPGALKNFLDHLPIESLEAKPVGIVAMGASPHHFLGVESDLMPIFSWFGAIYVPPGIYLTSKSFENGQPVPDAAEMLKSYAASMIDAAGRLTGFRLRPRPLAARPPG